MTSAGADGSDAVLAVLGELVVDLLGGELRHQLPAPHPLAVLDRQPLDPGGGGGLQVGLARRSKRLIVLDVDSTLVRGEVIDELAARMYDTPHEFNAEMQAEAWAWLEKWV